jgi:exodeoxyribonuclease V alpha subunit
MNRGLLGTENLNAELRKRLNPGPAELVLGSREFRTGDKAMQIVNNYDKEVFNGDIGWIIQIDPERKEVTIDFDGRSLCYDGPDLEEIVPAYAISVHKSQGSEYPAIILPVSTQHYVLLQKNLLYTGMTRARRLAVLVGTTRALGIALRNNRPEQRYTRLAWRLKADA